MAGGGHGMTFAAGNAVTDLPQKTRRSVSWESKIVSASSRNQRADGVHSAHQTARLAMFDTDAPCKVHRG